MNSPFIIPIVAIVMGCLIPIVVVIVDYRKKRAIYELHHRERLAAIEKGMELPPLPPDLQNGTVGPRLPANHLLRGLIWSAVGIGILIAFQELEEDAAKLGIIPLAVGIAYLLYYVIEGRKRQRQTTPPETSGPAHV